MQPRAMRHKHFSKFSVTFDHRLRGSVPIYYFIMSCIQLYSFEPRKSNSNDNKKPERRVNRELIDRSGKTDWCDCGECVKHNSIVFAKA